VGTAVFLVVSPRGKGERIAERRKGKRKSKRKVVKTKRMEGKNVILQILSAVRKKENK